MKVPIFQVDAFTDKPFTGNPAAVCILPQPQETAWMQNVAREINLSETAFVLRQEDGFTLRWFTPIVEVDLCGHATLASAHILWETRLLDADEPARFQTRSGLLTAQRQGSWIEMDFPADLVGPADPPLELIVALGIQPKFVGRSRFDYLIEVDSEETVRAVQPDFELLCAVPTRGVILTSQATSSQYDFVSRFFAPAVGISEDPVTGSAHCCLGPFWHNRLGKEKLVAYQASARGGVVHVHVRGNRVLLSGQAVTILQGELLL
jgi:PhzF family phenazine biosynthesis protein